MSILSTQSRKSEGLLEKSMVGLCITVFKNPEDTAFIPNADILI